RAPLVGGLLVLRSHAPVGESRDFAAGGPISEAGPERTPYPARVDEHYFSPSPGTAERRLDLPVRLAGRDLVLVSSASVFSARGLDRATAVLLDRLDTLTPPRSGARILDLGCGWGPIALTAALTYPDAQVWA